MMLSSTHDHAHPFFMQASMGERFCLYHAPPDGPSCRGAWLYIHPFAEEMNKARRMAALQARMLAGMGFAVLQIDLFGCGDSAGELRAASWEQWKDDIVFAAEWLEHQTSAPVSLWGLRLGALLALDVANDSRQRFDTLLLWQPLISGESFLTQFLRLRLANQMLGGSNGGSSQDLRNALRNGEILEVAGYDITPQLASDIDRLRLDTLAVTSCPVHWLEVVAEGGREPSPASQRVATRWRNDGVNLHLQTVPGPTFWSAQEIQTCPALLSASAAAIAETACL